MDQVGERQVGDALHPGEGDEAVAAAVLSNCGMVLPLSTVSFR
jgi:hypothetical protein